MHCCMLQASAAGEVLVSAEAEPARPCAACSHTAVAAHLALDDLDAGRARRARAQGLGAAGGAWGGRVEIAREGHEVSAVLERVEEQRQRMTYSASRVGCVDVGKICYRRICERSASCGLDWRASAGAGAARSSSPRWPGGLVVGAGGLPPVLEGGGHWGSAARSGDATGRRRYPATAAKPQRSSRLDRQDLFGGKQIGTGE